MYFQFLEGPYQLCIHVSVQLQWLCILCLCRARLVLTVAAEKLREVALWAFLCPIVDLIKAGLLSSLSWAVTLQSLKVSTPETRESSLTFPYPFIWSQTFLTMNHSNKWILPYNPEHLHLWYYSFKTWPYNARWSLIFSIPFEFIIKKKN